MTTEQGTLFNPGWFRVSADATDCAGEIRLSAWIGSAIAGERIQICPLCRSVVTGDWAGTDARVHERWHARTDFPIPPELEVTS